MGAHILAIKDMSALLKPYAAIKAYNCIKGRNINSYSSSYS